MKKKITIALLAALLGAFTPAMPTDAAAGTRTADGTYCDYMCVVTADGSEWLLSDAHPAKNPYMKKITARYNGRRKQVYVPIFRAGQKVRVKFDTNGTRKKADDKIISVKPAK